MKDNICFRWQVYLAAGRISIFLIHHLFFQPLPHSLFNQLGQIYDEHIQIKNIVRWVHLVTTELLLIAFPTSLSSIISLSLSYCQLYFWESSSIWYFYTHKEKRRRRYSVYQHRRKNQDYTPVFSSVVLSVVSFITI